jgi:hypothetical protein
MLAQLILNTAPQLLQILPQKLTYFVGHCLIREMYS